jgi:hypothetical protein
LLTKKKRSSSTKNFSMLKESPDLDDKVGRQRPFSERPGRVDLVKPRMHWLYGGAGAIEMQWTKYSRHGYQQSLHHLTKRQGGRERNMEERDEEEGKRKRKAVRVARPH